MRQLTEQTSAEMTGESLRLEREESAAETTTQRTISEEERGQ